MSNNTNTLFWVITGAVVVLSVFLLIKNNEEDSLNRINDKFNNVAQSQINNSGGDEYYIDRFSCGASQVSVDGYDVYVTEYHDNGYDSSYFFWHIVNNNTEYDYDNFLHITIYTCNTNEAVMEVDWPIDFSPPQETTYISSSGGTIRGNWEYYVTADIRPRTY